RAPRAREPAPGILLLEYLSLLHELLEATSGRKLAAGVRGVGSRWSPKHARALNQRSGAVRVPRRSSAAPYLILLTKAPVRPSRNATVVIDFTLLLGGVSPESTTAMTRE